MAWSVVGEGPRRSCRWWSAGAGGCWGTPGCHKESKARNMAGLARGRSCFTWCSRLDDILAQVETQLQASAIMYESHNRVP